MKVPAHTAPRREWRDFCLYSAANADAELARPSHDAEELAYWRDTAEDWLRGALFWQAAERSEGAG